MHVTLLAIISYTPNALSPLAAHVRDTELVVSFDADIRGYSNKLLRLVGGSEGMCKTFNKLI